MCGWASGWGAGPSCPCMWFHPYPGAYRASPCLKGVRVVALCVSVCWACHNAQPPTSIIPLLSACSKLAPAPRASMGAAGELAPSCQSRTGPHVAPCVQGCAPPWLLKHMVTSSNSPCSKRSRSRLQVCNLRKTNKCRAAWLYLSETQKLWFTGSLIT